MRTTRKTRRIARDAAKAARLVVTSAPKAERLAYGAPVLRAITGPQLAAKSARFNDPVGGAFKARHVDKPSISHRGYHLEIARNYVREVKDPR